MVGLHRMVKMSYADHCVLMAGSSKEADSLNRALLKVFTKNLQLFEAICTISRRSTYTINARRTFTFPLTFNEPRGHALVTGNMLQSVKS